MSASMNCSPWKICQPRAELLPVLHVARCELERAPGNTERLCPHERTRTVERAHRVVEAPAFTADEISAARDCRRARAHRVGEPRTTELAFELEMLETRKVFSTTKQLMRERRPPNRSWRTRCRSRSRRVGDPQLASRKNEMVAVTNGTGEHAGDVAAAWPPRGSTTPGTLPRRRA